MIVQIPGEPCAQGRPRFVSTRGFVRAYDPAKSRSWKADARSAMVARMGGTTALPFPSGPLAVWIHAVFTCPKGDHRKRNKAQRRPHAKRPDAENVAKAVLDAATSVLWHDDAQVAQLTVVKEIGGQDEAPYVRIEVLSMPESARPRPESERGAKGE